MSNGRPNLSDEERNIIAQWLLQNCEQDVLRYGAKKEASIRFHVDVRTIFRIWKSAQHQQTLGKPINVVSMKRGCQHLTKRKHLDSEKMRNLSFTERTSIRSVSSNLGVSVGLVHRWIKSKKVKAHTNAIKPFLTEANKVARMKWSLSMLSCISANGKIAFQTMYNIIHVDEKWFNLSRTSQRYYLLADEEGPHRTCKSKAHIDKIMFMSAVSRPIKDMNGNVIFDGKFGIFPFIFKEPAQRNSKNREKGTIITRPIAAVTKPVMRSCFIEWLVPLIKAKWPEGVSRFIIIQQDNAKPHISNSDPEFQAVAQSDGFNIKLVCQTPNSPDTNVNDLGFFRSIQSLKDKNHVRTVDDLIKNVEAAFEEYPCYKLNDVFLTLQCCYKEIIKVKGCNNYKIPHMGKKRLRSLGILPECIEVDEQLVQESLEYLNMQQVQGIDQISHITLESLVNGMEHVNITE